MSKGICEWSDNWIRNGWITSGGQPVKNADLFREILALKKECIKNVDLKFEWVKGHNKSDGNERADSLAFRAAQAAENMPGGGQPEQPEQMTLL